MMRNPYPSDLTDDQWTIIEPLIPIHATGRHRTYGIRGVLIAIYYLVRSGCQWGMLSHDLPARSTVYNHFARRRDDGTWQPIMDGHRREVRSSDGRKPSQSAGVIDSQTVKGSEVGGERGDDGGKKLRRIERHIVVDTLGSHSVVAVSAASAAEGTSALEVLRRLTLEPRGRLEPIWAD